MLCATLAQGSQPHLVLGELAAPLLAAAGRVPGASLLPVPFTAQEWSGGLVGGAG